MIKKMAELTKLYSTLEAMVKVTALKNKDELQKLNLDYNTLSIELYKKMPEDLKLAYDLCAVSCVSSLGIFFEMHDEFLKDAKLRFSKIPKP